MKKFFSTILLLFMLLVLTILTLATVDCFKSTELKDVKINKSRIVSTDLMSDEEQLLLDSNLKRNDNVLLLYYETDEDLDSEKEKLIIGNYTKETIPYVIFAYNPNNQTLKTVSSSKEILEFNDISKPNITSYTEVYKYIPGIKSKIIVPYVSQNKLEVVFYIIFILIYCIGLVYVINDLYKALKCNLYWQNDRGYLYKEGFCERGYKVKIDPDASDVIAMYTNVPIVKGKDYFYIPNKDKNDRKNKIMIETVEDVRVYGATKFGKPGFFQECLKIKWRLNIPEIKKIKSKYKYCVKVEKDDEKETENS